MNVYYRRTTYRRIVLKFEGKIAYERGMLALDNNIKIELKIDCVDLNRFYLPQDRF